jgi:hypothetical protein
MMACTFDTFVSSVCADWMTTANYMQSFQSVYKNSVHNTRHSTEFKAGVSVEPSPAFYRTSHRFHNTVVKVGVSPETPSRIVPFTMVSSEASSDTRPAC